MEFNKDKLIEETGLCFDSLEDAILYFQNAIEFLASHNKNYNNRQYNIICDIQAFFNSFEF